MPKLTTESFGEGHFKHNLGRDLAFLHRQYSQGLMQKSLARGHSGLKLNWDTVFINLNFRDGSRLVDIAQVNSMTKQAMSQIVADIESHGYLTKELDPADGRARKLKLTEQGERLIVDSLQAQQELEAEYCALLGEEKFAQFKALVAELVQLKLQQNKAKI